LKSYLRKNGIRLAAAVLAVVLITVISVQRLNGRAGLLANATGALRMPLQQAATSLSEWLEGIYGYIYKYDQLVEENESLRRQLSEAQEAARAAAEVSEENDRLRELLGYLEKHRDFETESARVVAWNASNWASAFTISKGQESGIEVGDCVISSAGALVGQISELGTGWATVRTVTDTNMNVGVLVGEVSGAAMLVGDFALMQEGCAKLAYLSEGTSLLQGDRVITSGKGGRFPQGVLVGTVSELRTEGGGQTTYGVVEPACDLSGLSQVFIITDFSVVE
jgi:rod shape-determining protein MreC